LIINRAYIREVAQTGAAVTIMIAGIFIVVRLVRFLSKAASGEIPVDSIFLLLALKVVTFMDLILPLTLYAAILIVISRWIRDNEFTVLQACGFGLYQLLKPTLVLVVAVSAMVAAFSFYLTPRAIAYTNRIMEEAKTRTEISGVVPGVFSDRQGRGVYYVENISPDGKTLENVFVYGKTPGKEDVVVAKDGYQYVDEQTGDRFLVLRNGTRYEGVPGQADYTVLEYQTYALRIKTKVEFKATTSVKSMSTTALLHSKDPKAIPEWHWRMSKPVSVPILAILALRACAAAEGQDQSGHRIVVGSRPVRGDCGVPVHPARAQPVPVRIAAADPRCLGHADIRLVYRAYHSDPYAAGDGGAVGVVYVRDLH
jgi:lipopolysaccharide export system permease protein